MTVKNIALVGFCLLVLVVGVVSCEAQERQPDTTLRLVQWSLYGSQMADAYTTIRALQSGAGREANPIMGWAADRPVVLAAVKIGTAVGLSYAIGKLAKRHRTAALILGGTIAGSVSLVALRNSRIR